MTDSEIRRRIAPPPNVLQGALKYWPIIVGCLMLIIAAVEVRLQANQNAKALGKLEQQLEADAANAAQWRRIRMNLERLTDQAARIKAVERHVTPEAIQRWGWAQQQIEANARDIREHLRGHPR